MCCCKPRFQPKSAQSGARDQLWVADKLQRAFVGPPDADFCQPSSHVHGALLAAAARGVQSVHHGGMGSVKAKADNVHRLAGKGHGHLGTRQKSNSIGFGGSSSALNAADFVVVGQCPQLYPVGAGARRERLGAKGAVGHNGVAVQVCVEKVLGLSRGHCAILGTMSVRRSRAGQCLLAPFAVLARL